MPKKNAVAEYLKEIGSRGGKSGTGAAKRRGGSDYYRKLARRRKAKKGGK
jgi:hypothetical protein